MVITAHQVLKFIHNLVFRVLTGRDVFKMKQVVRLLEVTHGGSSAEIKMVGSSPIKICYLCVCECVSVCECVCCLGLAVQYSFSQHAAAMVTQGYEAPRKQTETFERAHC